MNIYPWHLRKVNIFLALLVGVVALIGSLFFFFGETREVERPPAPEKVEKITLPESFKPSEEAAKAIGEPFLHLEQGLPTTKLPDIRPLFISYGIILRPDNPPDKSAVLLGMRGGVAPIVASFGEKIYLRYNGQASALRWSFSPKGVTSTIWLELEQRNNQIIAHLKMVDSHGNLITEPTENSSFILPETPFVGTPEAMKGWTIGSFAVDAALFENQKAKWYGKDIFLQEFGGPEYSFANDSERIEFDAGTSHYALYLKEGDLIAWDEQNGMWNHVSPGRDSRGKTIAVVKKVSDTAITFDLWDPEGTKKTTLELHKLPPIPLSGEPSMRLIGARSRQDWIVESAGKRILLRSDDWLLSSDGKCEKIQTAEQLDDWLSGTLGGELIILERVERKDNTPCLLGTRISASRTQAVPFELSMAKACDFMKEVQGNPPPEGRPPDHPSKGSLKEESLQALNSSNERDEDDDDDDDDDEEYK
jgi:hypothetical protein